MISFLDIMCYRKDCKDRFFIFREKCLKMVQKMFKRHYDAYCSVII